LTDSILDLPEYTTTPKHLRFGVQLLLNSKVNAINFWQCLKNRICFFRFKKTKNVSNEIAVLSKKCDLFFTCQLLLRLKEQGGYLVFWNPIPEIITVNTSTVNPYSRDYLCKF